MGKQFPHWLSQHGNDFITDWVNAEIIFSITEFSRTNFAGLAQSSYCIRQPLFFSLELSIYELLTAPIQSFLALSLYIWASSYMHG